MWKNYRKQFCRCPFWDLHHSLLLLCLGRRCVKTNYQICWESSVSMIGILANRRKGLKTQGVRAASTGVICYHLGNKPGRFWSISGWLGISNAILVWESKYCAEMYKLLRWEVKKFLHSYPALVRSQSGKWAHSGLKRGMGKQGKSWEQQKTL